MNSEIKKQDLANARQKPVEQKPDQKQKVKVAKVNKTDKGIVISFTKA